MDKLYLEQQAQLLGIGNTPLIPYEEDFDADIYVKDETQNASGSIKDRSALAMILVAEEQGLLHKGDTIVEATSGNMGISLAYVGVKRGYKVLLTMPDTMSVERRELLQGLGAQLVLTEGATGMRGAMDMAEQYSKRQGHVLLHQFDNPSNVLAHYLTTADEIVADLDKIDVFVSGVGTGGTLMGIAKRLKELNPNVQVVAVEPANSAVLSGRQSGSHVIQGIGAGFVSSLYDSSLVDRIELVTDEQALDTFRLLNKKQGYCCGLSSGANIAVCVRLAEDPAYKGKNIVTVFPDGDDRYLSLLKQKSE